jgi:hypothetical protein
MRVRTTTRHTDNVDATIQSLGIKRLLWLAAPGSIQIPLITNQGLGVQLVRVPVLGYRSTMSRDGTAVIFLVAQLNVPYYLISL